jgi:chromate transporter
MNDELSALPRKRVLWLLFFHFLKISFFVVGGGYAIILAAENVFVKKLRWLRDGELVDMLAIIQSVPGLMAGNIAIYIGYRSAGRLGALIALAGVALPSFLIITVISAGFSQLPMDNCYVQGAFIGVRSALGGLVLAALLRSWPKIMTDRFCYLIMGICFAGILFFKLNPALLLAGAMIAGILFCRFSCRKLDKSELARETKI